MNWVELKSNFAKLYANTSPLLEYGPPKGWLDIVFRLSTKIQSLIDNGEISQITAVQVKEKFRGLRFYYEPYIDSNNLQNLIYEAESESLYTCQSCGIRVTEGREGPGFGVTMCCDCYSDMQSQYSPFCKIPENDWITSNKSAFAVYDNYPVNPNHVLIISRRCLPSWWDLSDVEHFDILALLNDVRSLLLKDSKIALGFNVGWNDGIYAGQTVQHFHLHLIPRYGGDVDDPSGGVRYVIPERGNYKTPGKIPTVKKI